MSEKYLTEKPWKDLIAEEGVKDIGLQKALVAYAKLDATKEPDKALEALKEITELAVKLKKTNAAKDEVVDHLDEVIKEVKKTTPALEAKLKEAAAAAAAAGKPGAKDEDEEEEAAEFKKDLKKQMVSALAQVKLRAPGDPEQEKEPKPQLKFMAYLAANVCAVVVARKVGAATKNLLPDIAGVASGGKFVQGECIFEKNTHTFVLDRVPGGLAKKLATALNAATGQKYKVRVRSTDGSTVLDSETDLDSDAAAAPAATPAASAEEMAKFTARFKALQKDVLQAIATKTPQGDEVKQRATEAGTLAKKKQFAEAHRVLDEVEALVKKALPGEVEVTKDNVLERENGYVTNVGRLKDSFYADIRSDWSLGNVASNLGAIQAALDEWKVFASKVDSRTDMAGTLKQTVTMQTLIAEFSEVSAMYAQIKTDLAAFYQTLAAGDKIQAEALQQEILAAL